jgi:hypothetical protein
MITVDNQILAEISNCASECMDCHEDCVAENKDHSLDRCIEITRNCSVFCQFTFSALTSDAEHADIYYCICADMCNRCAAECEKFDYPFCLRCAVACRKCAAACEMLVDDVLVCEPAR